MTATINLTRYTAAPNALPLSGQQCWPLIIEATAIGISPKVFVYRAAAQGDPFGGDAFSCIASVNQMYELPADEGYIGAQLQIPFYRSDRMEVFCRSQVEADYIWQVVNEDIQSLVTNFNLMSALQGTATSAVTSAGATITTVATTGSMAQPGRQRIQINYQPAGTATLVNNLQDMTDANAKLSGWLPASLAPSGWVVPNGAKFFYNIEQDSVLQAFWPLPSPASSNQMFLNGFLLPYGVVYTITQNTIWWLDFDPSSIVRPALVGMTQQGNAPWPADYVNADNPGAVSPQLVIFTAS